MFVQYFPSFLNGDVPIPVISEDLNAGVVYKGLADGRNEDVVGAGIAWARLDQGGTNQETAVEVFYRARITPSLSIQPDIQYIATPSGVYPDALVVGIRFQLDY